MDETMLALLRFYPCLPGFSDHKIGVLIPQDEDGRRRSSISMAPPRATHVHQWTTSTYYTALLIQAVPDSVLNLKIQSFSIDRAITTHHPISLVLIDRRDEFCSHIVKKKVTCRIFP